MNIKRFLIVIFSFLALIPSVVLAAPKECSSYSVDSCPASGCIIENGACVKGHIGQGVCSQEEVMNGLRVAGYFLFIARIFIPFIVIGFGTFDMFKAVTGGDDKSMISSAKKLGIRALIGLSIFLVPSIIHIVLSTLNDYNAITDDANVCQTCLLKPSECENGVPANSDVLDRDVFVHDDETEEQTDDNNDEIVVE